MTFKYEMSSIYFHYHNLLMYSLVIAKKKVFCEVTEIQD